MSAASNNDKLTEAEFTAMRMLVAWLARQNEGKAFDPAEVNISANPVAGYLVFGVDSEGTVIKNNDVLKSAMILIWSILLDFSETSGRPLDDIIGAIGVNVARHDPHL